MCRVMVTQGLKWLGLNYSINEVRNRHTFTATTPRLPSYICHYVIESGLQRCANGISAQHHVDPAGLCACHSLTHLLTHTLSLSLSLSLSLYGFLPVCFPFFCSATIWYGGLRVVHGSPRTYSKDCRTPSETWPM